MPPSPLCPTLYRFSTIAVHDCDVANSHLYSVQLTTIDIARRYHTPRPFWISYLYPLLSYYPFDCAVTSSARRSSTSDTEHRLIVSTSTSHRLNSPLRHPLMHDSRPCFISAHVLSCINLITTINATPHNRPTSPRTSLPGRCHQLELFSDLIVSYYPLSHSLPLVDRHLVQGICRSILL